MTTDTPEAKYWVWTQHGDAEFIFAVAGPLEEAVDRFAESRRVPFGTSIYVTAADNVTAFKVGAVPR